MVKVTEKAAYEMINALAANSTELNQSFRLAFDSNACSMRIDWIQEDDNVVEIDGKVILVMDQEVNQFLADAVIDCIDTPEGACLTIYMGETASCDGANGLCSHGCNCH